MPEEDVEDLMQVEGSQKRGVWGRDLGRALGGEIYLPG